MAAESSELRAIRGALHAAASPERAIQARRFFKTGPGDYAEGDIFLGVKVPDTRRIARDSDRLAERDIVTLLRSPIHEERLLALLVLVRRYQRRASERERLVETFLREKKFVNNWDLVDSSAPLLLGPWLLDRDRSILDRLAASPSLWDRRIAILATFAFIRAGDFSTTLALAKTLLPDEHDLMHKAVGWMLREVGNRDEAVLRTFLDQHAASAPRTLLRYAIERLPATTRSAYLARPRIGKPVS
ncbi:MAG TPA: DNA alkylation repair protein [Chthoniobacterales bacterium]